MPPLQPSPLASEQTNLIGTSAQLIATGPSGLAADEAYQVRVLNVGGATVSIGPSGVTAGGGVDQVTQGDDSVVSLAANEQLYAIAAAGGAYLRIYGSRAPAPAKPTTSTGGAPADLNALGTASNPITNPAGPRNAALTVNYWRTATQPAGMAIGDEWTDVS